VLHYSANNAQMRDGDLVLIDAGCEFDSYASDITRTFPVNGRFTQAQKTLYELVLRAQGAALQAIVPGRPYSDVHEAALKVLVEGMLDLGLLDKAAWGSVENVLAERAYTPVLHARHRPLAGTGRARHRQLPRPCAGRKAVARARSRHGAHGRTGHLCAPGPGVPEQFWNIGIRIEDDVIVGEAGARVLSGAAPKTVDEIETLMAER
jgi:Xaa-Pro aminopeptidase